MSAERPVVLAVGAHPDDVEFLFGGTLVALRESQGDNLDIYMITVCNGNMGSMELKPAELRAARWNESLDAAAVIGAYYDTCDINDLRAHDDYFLARDILVARVRQIKPDIVMTHTPNDRYMPDHRETPWIVSDALFCAMLPNYDPYERNPESGTRRTAEGGIPRYVYEGDRHPLPALYYGDPFPGHDIFGERQQPTFILDISGGMGTKVDMLLKHKSQGAWLASGHGDSDYIKTAREWNAQWGQEGSPLTTYFEAFLRHQGAPYPQDARLENLLPEDKIMMMGQGSW